MSTTPIIETYDLKKSFGHVEAVRGLTMSIASNRITAFLGLNGAGKSTTIKMLLGMISPTGGEGIVSGKRVGDSRQGVDLRRQVAYVSEYQRLYDYMTVEQMIRFTRSFYPTWDKRIEQTLLRTYELPPNRKVRSLSKGMRRKLANHVLLSNQMLLALLWVLAVTLLMMGGLLREHALGAALFTLALPVSRRRLMTIRIGMGLAQASALAIVPSCAMYLIALTIGKAYSPAQFAFHLCLLLAGGSIFFAIAVLTSSLIEGEYTAPAVSLGVAVSIALGLGSEKLKPFNPLVL